MPLTPEEIAERFDISLPAARVRVTELARMQRRATGQLRELPRGVADFLLDQKRKGFRVTSVDQINSSTARTDNPKSKRSPD
jgi:hypothetical protein